MISAYRVSVGTTPVILATGATKRGSSQVFVRLLGGIIYVGDSSVVPGVVPLGNGFKIEAFPAPDLVIDLGDGDSIYGVQNPGDAPAPYTVYVLISS